jgi:hypothetical protein
VAAFVVGAASETRASASGENVALDTPVGVVTVAVLLGAETLPAASRARTSYE